MGGRGLPATAEKRQVVEAMFDRVAPSYDRLNRVISLGQDARWRRHTIDALALPGGSTVLDLACGTGDLCTELAARRHHPVGLDFSAGMLAAAHTTAALVRGDAAALPVADATCDGIVCGFALRNFVDLAEVFAECARVLRAGGRFVALDAAVPEHALLRLGHTAWFRGAVPLVARVLGGDAAAYRYLPRSTAYLPEPAALLALLRASGFTSVERHTLTGGAVQLLVGTR